MNALGPGDRTPVIAEVRPSRQRLAELRAWWRRQRDLMARPRIEAAWSSVRGRSHERNQDAVMMAPPFFAVADGVGGGSSGELASSQMLAWCRDIPATAWQRPETLSEWIKRSDDALAHSLSQIGPAGASATTFAGVWLRRSGVGLVAHVGDSRVLHVAYRHGCPRLTALTQDQTYAAMGETPPPGSRDTDPARMVGVGAIGEPPVIRIRLRENECLLLCSDGFHGYAPPSLVTQLFQRAYRENALLSPLAAQLTQAARAQGSPDDISVVLVRKNPRFGARATFWACLALAVAVGLAWTLKSYGLHELLSRIS